MQETNWKQAGSELKIEQTKNNHEGDDIPETCYFCFLFFIFLDFFFLFFFCLCFQFEFLLVVDLGVRVHGFEFTGFILVLVFMIYFFFGHLCVVFSSIEVHAWVYFTVFGCGEDGGKERKRKKKFDCMRVFFIVWNPRGNESFHGWGDCIYFTWLMFGLIFVKQKRNKTCHLTFYFHAFYLVLSATKQKVRVF